MACEATQTHALNLTGVSGKCRCQYYHRWCTLEALCVLTHIDIDGGFDFWCTPSCLNQAWGTPKVETTIVHCSVDM